MGFWLFMLVCGLLIPGIMIVFGRIFLTRPPKKINSVYGYRTTMSMKNADTWRFAHTYCGRLWQKLGWVLLVASAAVMLVFVNKPIPAVSAAGSILCCVQCVIIAGSIFPIERALKQEFDSSGRKKHPTP